jgi:hypothetical protein
MANYFFSILLLDILPAHRLAWSAPELLASDSVPHSRESDAYAYGVTVWEIMSVGATPFAQGQSATLFSLQTH